MLLVKCHADYIPPSPETLVAPFAWKLVVAQVIIIYLVRFLIASATAQAGSAPSSTPSP